MSVRDVMTPDVRVVTADATLRQAAQIMEKTGIGALPVAENRRLIGMITDRDITVRAVAQGKAPEACKARDVMSSKLKYIYDDTSLDDAARIMAQLRVRRLAVIDRNKQVVGIVSLADLAKAEADGVAHALSSISRRAA